MADFPFDLADPTLSVRLALALDIESKIPRALAALGPIADRDVVLIDGGGGLRAGQLADLGGRVTVVERRADDAAVVVAVPSDPGIVAATGLPTAATRPAAATLPAAARAEIFHTVGLPAATGLPTASADVVVACWSAFHGPDPGELGEAARILRPGGRLLVLHDYGRDDISRLRDPGLPEYTTWSRRDGPFLAGGFKVRVIHCWWTFDSVEEAASLLRDGFGAAAEPVAAGLVRPRLSYNVAIYHRTMPDATRP